MDSALPLRHLLLALLVVAIWGTNFAVIRIGLDETPPLVFAALRFALAALPAVFFVRRPRATSANLAAFGLLIGVGQFAVLFIAMDGWISPGLASLVVQSQVFFTIGLAVWLRGERVGIHHVVALLLGAAGIALIGVNTGGSATVTGLALVLFAGLSWAAGNMVAKASGETDMLAYVVWSSLFATPALVLLALAVEGPAVTAASLWNAGLETWAAVLWQATGNTLFGFGAWAFLLSRYPAASVTPTALLVPVFGIAASNLVLGEPVEAWKLGAAALVIAGLAVAVFAPRWRRGSGRP